MRKVIVFNWVSLDGFIAGANGETDWFVWDKEIEEYYKDVQATIDAILYGRTTYQTMANYWPTSDASSEDPMIRNHMNNSQKIVFSNTLKKAEWHNSTLIRKIVEEEIMKMKHQTGKNLVIYGSSSLVEQFTKLELIDEYKLMMNPVVLGSGKPIFNDMNYKLNLQLLKTRQFRSGAVMLDYRLTKS